MAGNGVLDPYFLKFSRRRTPGPPSARGRDPPGPPWTQLGPHISTPSDGPADHAILSLNLLNMPLGFPLDFMAAMTFLLQFESQCIDSSKLRQNLVIVLSFLCMLFTLIVCQPFCCQSLCLLYSSSCESSAHSSQLSSESPLIDFHMRISLLET